MLSELEDSLTAVHISAPDNIEADCVFRHVKNPRRLERSAEWSLDPSGPASVDSRV